MTTTIAPPLTVEVVRDLLNQAVAERGADYVYPGLPDENVLCKYVLDEDGKQVPGCLLGDVLHRAGVPLHILSNYEGRAVDDIVGPKGLVLASDNIVRYGMAMAQEEQDAGKTWGRCVERYEEFIQDPTIFGVHANEVAERTLVTS